ncbi:MAG TPA: serine hydrolase domain-containing protein [Opitutaceae bacterium]|nr:serine hydrolase domain-containing protein [Opitutaceae bacterium]
MRPVRVVAAVLAGLIASVSHAAEPPPANAAQQRVLEQARALVRQEMAPKVPGMSAAVAIDGKLVWSEGFGYADVAAKKPVTTTTRFRIGSISKSLTAVGLALLVEQGRVDLDAPVQRYVPEFPDKGVVITTRQLAGHLGGIRHYRGTEMFLNKPYANSVAAFSIFARDPLEAPPGTKYIYSTYGWSVISAVMEAATKQDFVAYMDAAVIQPLGLTHTRADRKGVVDPDRTEFYQSNAAGAFVVAPPVDNSYKWAGGGFLSTSEDLVRFGSALLEPGFLKAETLVLLFTPQKTADGKRTTYGIGWNVGTDAHGHRYMMHTGGSIGGTSALFLHPQTRTVVALVCNHSSSPFTKARWEALAEMFAPLYAAR